jgi:hypothetical protein
VALLYKLSPHVTFITCFKDVGYQRTAMDLRGLKQAELHSGMCKIAEI